MCGIAGILEREGRQPTRTALEAMQRAIAHRGPDQHDLLVEGPLGLAATRLALLDLSDAGAQPMQVGRTVLAFNGEVYNHAEIGRELEGAGVRFRGRSDTEVVAVALERWGVEATLPRLQGMFALAFAELDRHRVWLARDRLGIKPLVWSTRGGRLAWASEAKALAALDPLVPDPVDALFAVTGRIERSTDRTAFVGVHQVPPGTWLRADAGAEPTSGRWWSLTDVVDEGLHRELAELGPAALADRLEHLLAAAVERMAVSDAPGATFLSGGVDSSLLTALAPPRPALVADVGGDRSERAAAAEVAAALDRPLVAVPFPKRAFLDDWATATWDAEAPIVTHVNALPFRRLAGGAQERGIKSVLTGEGADELFYGYPEIAAAPMRRRLHGPGRWLRRAARRLPSPLASTLGGGSMSQPDFLVDLVGHFDDRALRQQGAAAFAFLTDHDAARQGEVFYWLGQHLPTLLHRNDAMGMARSVEARFPYLDEDVVAFGVNLPVRAKVAPSRRLVDAKHPFLTDKAILRAVGARHLPATVAHRRKAGFPMYGHHHVRTTPAFWAGGYVADLLGLGAPTVARLVEENDPYLVAKLASVEVFGRLFGRGEDPASVTAHLRAGAVLA